jgi:anhydro-N-acetylmuramic acid kinase
MTGTSCDGIDLAYVEFNENSDSFLNVIAFETLNYPAEASQFVSECINEKKHISELSQFGFYLSEIFAESINEFLSARKIPRNEVDFIAVHGQTLWHNPMKENFLNRQISSTYQAVNLSALAKLTGIHVIGDLRSGDIALGGQGAPLVTIFDYDFFQDNSKDRILLNIGGISNLTYLPKENSKENMMAFDCGQGNTLLDLACNKYFGVGYDKDGEIAKSGILNEELLSLLFEDGFIKSTPPKSTGREKYNLAFLENALSKLDYSPKPSDILRTLTEFTAEAISFNIKNFCTEDFEIIISGGGRNNIFLMDLLASILNNSTFVSIEQFGIPSDGKEAIAFAYLGWLYLKGITGNLPSATGAKRSTILGTFAI